jgi:hypothetical protein
MSEKTVRKKSRADALLPVVGAVIEVNCELRLFRSVVTVDVGSDDDGRPRALIAEVSAVCNADTADETAELESAVPLEIDVCAALLIAELKVWVAD